MKKNNYLSFSFIFLILALAVSCKDANHQVGELTRLKGGCYTGGVFRVNSNEEFRTLYPPYINEDAGLHIGSLVFEGLVKLNQSNLAVIPCLAEKIDKSADCKEWTFQLRKGVKFHDNPCFEEGKGREVTAQDFKFCFDRLCEFNPDNQQYSITFKDRVKGASEYNESTKKGKPLVGGVAGVQVVDDYTVKITLNYPFSGFLNVLAMPGCWLYPKEALEKYGKDIKVNCVGTGPFELKTATVGESLLLERNRSYWGKDENGNQLPYLDAVKYTFVKDKKQELAEFKKGNLDMIFGLPTEMISQILDQLAHAKDGSIRFDVQRVPAMGIEYYGFQHKDNLFEKRTLRLAFNYAIDRDKIVNQTLEGDGIPATCGIVPPTFNGFSNKTIRGYRFNPDTAKLLLAKAGYPNGKGFPKITLEINNGGEQHIRVAEAIQQMLKENLNIEVTIHEQSFTQHMQNYETGKSLFWRTSWVADYPDPESFLTVLYGKHVPANLYERSYVNSVRYQSVKFDSLFELALREQDGAKRLQLYAAADQVQVDDAAIMPIYYHENYRLIQQWVKNFDANPLEYRDLTNVYFIPKSEIRSK